MPKYVYLLEQASTKITFRTSDYDVREEIVDDLVENSDWAPAYVHFVYDSFKKAWEHRSDILPGHYLNGLYRREYRLSDAEMAELDKEHSFTKIAYRYVFLNVDGEREGHVYVCRIRKIKLMTE